MAAADVRGEILRFIQAFTDRRGYAPSVREIGEAVGLKSPSTVLFHLRILRERGLIDYQDGVSRSIMLLQPAARRPRTVFANIRDCFERKDGPLSDPAKLAAFLAAVQRSDLRDALEWLEYLMSSEKNNHIKGEES